MPRIGVDLRGRFLFFLFAVFSIAIFQRCSYELILALVPQARLGKYYYTGHDFHDVLDMGQIDRRPLDWR